VLRKINKQHKKQIDILFNLVFDIRINAQYNANLIKKDEFDTFNSLDFNIINNDFTIVIDLNLEILTTIKNLKAKINILSKILISTIESLVIAKNNFDTYINSINLEVFVTIDNYKTRLIASGRLIEFGSINRTESGRVGSKSWNRKVGSIPKVGTENRLGSG